VPGANLAPGLRDKQASAAIHPNDSKPVRDAESSRSAFDGYVSGVARAAAHSDIPHQRISAMPFDESEHQ